MLSRESISHILEHNDITEKIQEQFLHKYMHDQDFRNNFLALYGNGQISSPFDPNMSDDILDAVMCIFNIFH